jgi:uncharacterized Tic20 family protein
LTDAAPTTPPSPPPPPPSAGSPGQVWPIACHLAAFAGILPLPVLGSVLGPLVVWFARRDLDPVVREHGKEAINFNLSFVIWGCVAWVLKFVLIGFVLGPVVLVAWMVLIVIAAVKASNGTLYRYPFTIRFID